MTRAVPNNRSRRGGLLVKLLLALCALSLLATVAWVMLLPGIVASTIRSRTGFAVQVEKLTVNPFTAKVHLAGLGLENPAGWPEKSFVQLREFRADADLFPLLGGRLAADEVVVDVAQVTLVKDKNGVLNAVAFKEALAGPSPAPAPEQPKPAGPAPEFLIRRLVVKFDRLVFADHSGRRPAVKEYNLGIDRELRDVDSVADLVSPFRGAAFAVVSEAIGGMFQGTARLLQDAAGLLQDAGGTLKDGGKKAGESLKGLLQQLEKKKP